MKIILGLYLCLAGVLSINAQITKVTGTVYDENGAVVVGTKVVLTEFGIGVTITHTTQTDNNGHYELKSEAGICELKFIYPNHKYKPLLIKKYIVVKTDKMYMDVVLELIKPKQIKRKHSKKYPPVML